MNRLVGVPADAYVSKNVLSETEGRGPEETLFDIVRRYPPPTIFQERSALTEGSDPSAEEEGFGDAREIESWKPTTFDGFTRTLPGTPDTSYDERVVAALVDDNTVLFVSPIVESFIQIRNEE